MSRSIPALGALRAHPSARAYLQLIRAPTVFTAVADVLAAWLIAGPDIAAWDRLFLLALASVLLYSAGMALNDCFDYADDLRERPERPLVSGAVPKSTGWRIGWSLLAAGLLVAALAGPVALLLAIGLAGLIVIYDAVASDTRAGPWILGGCRYGNWLLGLAVSGLALDLLWLPLPVFGYVVALSLLAQEEARAADRRPLRNAGALVIGAALSVLLLYQAGLLSHVWAIVLVLPGLAVVLELLRRTARAYTPAKIQKTVKLLLLGIIPLDAVLAWAGGPIWGGLAVLALLLPSRLLARSMYVT